MKRANSRYPLYVLVVLGAVGCALAGLGIANLNHRIDSMTFQELAAFSPSGKMYIVDPVNNIVRCCACDGAYLYQWGSRGYGDGQFDSPGGITVSRDGMVYVADTYNHRIQKFLPDGTFVAKWGSYGFSEGKFNRPYFIATDSQGFIYVLDAGRRFQKFNQDGELIIDGYRIRAGYRGEARPCWENEYNTCD